VDSMSLYITVLPNTVSAFHQIPFNVGCEPFEVCFTDYSVGVENGSSLYLFGNGESSSEFSPCYTYQNAGIYDVMQIITNGCSYDTAYSFIQVLTDPTLTVTADTLFSCANVPIQFFSDVDVNVGYNWDFEDGTSSSESDPLHEFATGGNYTAVLEVVGANGCNATDSISVQIYDVPVADFTPATTIDCSPFNLCVSAASSAGNFYYWDFGDGTNAVGTNPCHTYINAGLNIIDYDVTLFVENLFECRDTAIIPINVLPQPTSAFTLSAFESCVFPVSTPSQNLSIGGLVYDWQIDGNSVSSESQPVLTFDSLGQHLVELFTTNQYNCSSVSSTYFTVHDIPHLDFTLNPAQGCVPVIVDFNNNSTNTDDYYWYFEDNFIDQSTNPTHIYNIPGDYDITLIGQNDEGCADTLTLLDAVHVYPYPTPQIQYQPTEPNIFEPLVYLQDIGGGATNWYWSLGDGVVSYDPFVEHTYETYGFYTVILTTSNDFGCTAQDAVTIAVKDVFQIYVPNAFTPSVPDGINDYFKPIMQGKSLITSYLFQIHDRWGNMVFETNDPDMAWVGDNIQFGQDVQGGTTFVQDGVYIWQVRVELKNSDEPRFLKGHVTVFR
jgi:PKD repeat protein